MSIAQTGKAIRWGKRLQVPTLIEGPLAMDKSKSYHLTTQATWGKLRCLTP